MQKPPMSIWGNPCRHRRLFFVLREEKRVLNHWEDIKMAEEKAKSKWSWVEFFKSKSFIAVLIATTIFVIYFLGIFKIRNEIVDWIVAVVWGAVLLIFVFSRALETAIENMKITAELKAGAQVTVNAEVAKLLEAIKTISSKKEGGN